jgi:hypothetical protein
VWYARGTSQVSFKLQGCVSHVRNNRSSIVPLYGQVAQLEEHGTITDHLQHPKVAGSIPVRRKRLFLCSNGLRTFVSAQTDNLNRCR